MSWRPGAGSPAGRADHLSVVTLCTSARFGLWSPSWARALWSQSGPTADDPAVDTPGDRNLSALQEASSRVAGGRGSDDAGRRPGAAAAGGSWSLTQWLRIVSFRAVCRVELVRLSSMRGPSPQAHCSHIAGSGAHSRKLGGSRSGRTPSPQRRPGGWPGRCGAGSHRGPAGQSPSSGLVIAWWSQTAIRAQRL
jgi:hypothetical protein